MIELLFYSYLTSIHIYICGYIFCYNIIDKNIHKKSSIFEIFFYGSFILCFITLILNFFISLNKPVNTIIFLLPFVLFLFLFNKNYLKKILFFSLPIAILFCLTIAYDGTYRPDAGSYHLPYISIINEHKILIGINNIHFRFGHTSVIQYLSSIYNNFLFGEKGIIIPTGLIYCNFIFYCIYEIFHKNNNNILKVLIFLILTFTLFRVNRYSDFGNDAPTNLLFFYLIIESLKNNEFFLKIKKTIFASTFIFLNKITLLLGFFIPVCLIFNKFKLNYLFNKVSIISILFIFLYSGKNILVSGCLMFPVEQTCIKKLFWYDSNSDRASNAINARLENESWTKGWMNQETEKKEYREYLKNFGWVKTWINSEGRTIQKKIAPYLIFIIILYIFALIFEKRTKFNSKNSFKLNNEYYICLIISFLGSLLWFLKFPVFRYGYGYLISFFSILLLFHLKNFKIISNSVKLKKTFKYIIILLILGVVTKNVTRIYKKSEIVSNIWPNIYGSEKNFQKKENLKIYKNGEIIFYISKNGECYYSKSPCTHFFNGKDFNIDEINVKKVFRYSIYYFDK